MFDLRWMLILAVASPLVAAVLTALAGPRLLGRRSHWPVILGIGLSLMASVAIVVDVAGSIDGDVHDAKTPSTIGQERVVTLWTWANIEGAADAGDFRIDVVLRADPLTAAMLAMVTFISLLVAIYSVGYMHDDPGYWRFFSYIGVFVFSMTALVTVSNFLLLYVLWESVGLCSYLLIGFWYQKPEAAAAGKKAFLVNRVGDFGFALGIFLIWTTYGTLDFHDTVVGGELVSVGVLGQTMLASPGLYVGGLTATALCLLLLTGACGKSAQLPLHVWLPDAMEGPTPVSALIHAATMVTAGVYMIARCTPLFAASPMAQNVVAIIGCATALVAGFIAMTQTDLKRILAYSTISQLGYMFLALGTGSMLGVVAGMFHLFTHAVFKALLFLGAGSVMHAMGGVIDINRFSGLRRLMPVTHMTFLFGCLALAGFPLFAGFFSKDEILIAVAERAGGGADAGLFTLLYWTALCTALLTAFYTFRAFFRTFHGEERIPSEAGDHAHESPLWMTVPLMVLAAGSLVVGGLFAWTGWLGTFLEQTPSLAFAAHETGQTHGSHASVMIAGSVAALLGIAVAAVGYLGAPWMIGGIRSVASRIGLYQLSRDKLYVDELYRIVFVGPLVVFGGICAWVDRWVIDGAVDGTGRLPKLLGAALRPLHAGIVPSYALAMLLGLLVLIGALLM